MKPVAIAVLVALCVAAHAKSLEEVLAEVKAPGVSVFAARGDKVIVEVAAGYANLEHKVKMRPDSVHELASISKQFTAAIVIYSSKEGFFRLTDSITKLYPDAPESWKDITVLHLLHHTSGLPDYLGELGDINREWTTAEMVNSIKDKPLRFEPGSKWEYSNSGYMLLGAMIEKINKRPTYELLTFIWSKFGMKHTYPNDTRSIIPNRADGYEKTRNGFEKEFFTSRTLCQTGDGQIMSTPRDLWLWTRALHSGKILEPGPTKTMLTPSPVSITEKDGVKSGYACGLSTLERKDGVVIYSHGGGWTGTSTNMIYNPENGVFMAVFCNMGGANLQPFMDYLSKKVAES